MPKTRATRHGSGPGWGGPAKGASTATPDARAPFEPGNAVAVGRVDPGEDGPDAIRRRTKEERAARLLEIVEAAAERANSELATATLPNEIVPLVNAASAAAARGHELLMGKHSVLTGPYNGPVQIEDNRAPLTELLLKALPNKELPA
jgi:hypothetical protein